MVLHSGFVFMQLSELTLKAKSTPRTSHPENHSLLFLLSFFGHMFLLCMFQRDWEDFCPHFACLMPEGGYVSKHQSSKSFQAWQKLAILKYLFRIRFSLFQNAQDKFSRCSLSSLLPNDSIRFQEIQLNIYYYRSHESKACVKIWHGSQRNVIPLQNFEPISMPMFLIKFHKPFSLQHRMCSL